jgi:predicted negative regulator of RcsB-dependent stress response
MASTTRLASSSSFDDTSENVADWMQRNARGLTIAVIVLLALAGGAWLWRSQAASKNARADIALARADGPLATGDVAGAQRELQTVATAYAGTPGGTQAALLLAKSYFDQAKYGQGLEVLKRVNDAPDDLRASVRALTGAGLEGSGKFADAAKAYDEAASAARFPVSRARYRADAARSYQLAGNAEAARKIWSDLSEDRESGLAEEAKVRLGELSAAKAGS